MENEIMLYGDIGDDIYSENNPKDFAAKLESLRGATTTLRVNSPGGGVFAAQTMYNLFKAHPAQKTVLIDGIVASAATLVTMGGDKIIMPVNALMMIHNPMAITGGDSRDMQKSAEVLEKVKDTIMSVYAERTNLSIFKISQLMDDETWMTAREAKDYGFIDEIDTGKEVSFSTENLNNMRINGKSVLFNKLSTVTALQSAIERGKREKNIYSLASALNTARR